MLANSRIVDIMEEENLEREIEQWVKENETQNSSSNKKIKWLEKRKRQGKRTSTIWEHFTMLEGGDKNKPRAACNYCNLDYAADTKSCGTSTLWMHVEHKCKKCPFSTWVEENKKKQSSILQFTKKTEDSPNEEVASSGQVVKFSQKVVREEISKYLIMDELPFRHIDGKGFQRLIRYFFPKFEFPSRVTIARDIYQLFLDEKVRLRKELLNHRLSLTTDCWTSIQNISYLCLTAHWVDNNWKMQKRIISFIQVPSHKGEMVGKELINCLNDWGITKVFAVTIDNAASNSVALDKVKEFLKEKNDGLVLNGEMFHVRCSAHILNLIVCDGLKELSYSISSIRNAVRYVRSSPARLKRFKEACKDEHIESKALLCLDVVTRWNSTYLMLEAAVKFKKAFKNLEGDANYTSYFEEKTDGNKLDGPPMSTDWDQAMVFIRFLKTFYELTLKFSGSLYVTSNLFFQEVLGVQVLLNDLKTDPDTLLANMASNMQQKYNKYWGRVEKLNLLTYIATILDPRFKFDVVNNGCRYLYEPTIADQMIAKIDKLLRSLYAFYRERLSPSQESLPPRQQPSHSSSSSRSSVAIIRQRFVTEEDDTNDLDDYLSDRREKLTEDHFDILKWWKEFGNKYKIVQQIAKDVLAVQVSTVASESAFSTGGRILDPFRSSLSPRMVEALICTKNWLTCEYEEPIVLKQYMDEIEALETSEQVAPGNVFNFLLLILF